MLIYLASPYTPRDVHDPVEKTWLKEERFKEVCKIAAKIMISGYQVFSPIAHSHPIEFYGKTPGDEEFWLGQDFSILQHCSQMWIAMLPGWELSSGVKRERAFCADRNIPVRFYNVHSGGISDAPYLVPKYDPQIEVRSA